MNYDEFIESKALITESNGFVFDVSELNPKLFSFQKDIVRWALSRGRAAIFAGCGLGKTAMQLEWAEKIRKKTGGKVLIVAPLAVSTQTKHEGEKFNIAVNICASQNDIVADKLNITNYEKLDHFIGKEFTAVVLDESSILKSYSGKVRNMIIEMFRRTPYKLACTATPAPNDSMELGNHSEFLGIMNRSEMLSMFFVHDGGETSKWRLKGHAESEFWKWLSSWSVVVDNPIDLGYTDVDYTLPELQINQIVVDGKASYTTTLSLTERRNARRDSLELRCQAAADLVNNSDEQWLIWCDLNDESDRLHELINNSINVRGSDSPDHKANAIINFSESKLHCLITKPSIAGFGINWQNCHNVIFVGLSDSYEQYYQAIRRCWRFGQKYPVNTYIIISAKEGTVKANIERKDADNNKFRKELVALTRDITKRELTSASRMFTEYKPTEIMILPKWEEFDDV